MPWTNITLSDGMIPRKGAFAQKLLTDLQAPSCQLLPSVHPDEEMVMIVLRTSETLLMRDSLTLVWFHAYYKGA
jgi:hypothetical protein